MSDMLIKGIEKPISPLALGTAFYRLESAEAHFEVLDAFVASGGTVIDSARTYGESEDVLGQWFEARPDVRDRVILITKCGHGPELKLPERAFNTSVREELQKSLATLKTDFIDLYMLHRDNHEMPVSTVMEPLQAALAENRVGAIGASNWEYRRVTEANSWTSSRQLPGFSIVSNTLSLARPAVAFYTGLVHVDPYGEAWHRDTGIPLLPWSSQARGFFTGAWTREMRSDPGVANPDVPTFDSRVLKVYATDDNFDRLDRAVSLGEKKGGYTAMEVGLAWLLHRPFQVLPVVGPRTLSELESCFRSVDLKLTSDERDWLDLKAPGSQP